jgi:hypothetical protein
VVRSQISGHQWDCLFGMETDVLSVLNPIGPKAGSAYHNILDPISELKEIEKVRNIITLIASQLS